MPSGWYNRGVHEVVSTDTNLQTHSLKCMLLKTTYAFNRDNEYVSDLSSHEISVAGYERQTLANAVLTANATLDADYLTADDPVFGPLATGQTIGFMVVFRDTAGADSTNPLLMCWQIVPTTTDGSEFVFEFADVGVSKFWSAT